MVEAVLAAGCSSGGVADFVEAVSRVVHIFVSE